MSQEQTPLSTIASPVRRWFTTQGWHLLALVCLFSAIGVAYWPSVAHGPRADQWCFLVDTLEQDDFWPLVSRTYSYSRTRVSNPGDHALFRPMLFVLLSAEKALFGHNFAWWQRTGILLHCLAVYLFLRILLLVHRYYTALDLPGEGHTFTARALSKPLAYALAFFFALNMNVMELVIWSHINGYIFFLICALAAMLLVMHLLIHPEASRARWRWSLGGAFVLLLLAAFTHEMGQFYAVAVGVVVSVSLYRRGQPRAALVTLALFASILGIYQLANRLDQVVHPIAHPDVSWKSVYRNAHGWMSLDNTVRYLHYTIVQPFFPWIPDWFYSGGRLGFTETPTLGQGCGAGIVLVLAGRGLQRLLLDRRRITLLLLLSLPCSLLVLHLALTVFGRMNLRNGPYILSSNSYYVYQPLLLALVLLYALLIAASRRHEQQRWALASPTFLLGSLVVLGLVGGWKVFQINVQVKNEFHGLRAQNNELLNLVSRRKSDPAFRFALDYPAYQAFEAHHGIPIAYSLYRRYADQDHPTDVIVMEGGKLATLTADEYRRRTSGLTLPSVPELVRPGTSYNLFRHEGRYHAVLHWDGSYRPERANHFYPVHGDTEDELEKNITTTIAVVNADIQAGRFIPPYVAVKPLPLPCLGYTLFQVGTGVYGVPEEEGMPVSPSFPDKNYSSWFYGLNEEDVRAQIRWSKALDLYGD